MKKAKIFGVGMVLLMVLLPISVTACRPTTTQEVLLYEEDDVSDDDDFFPRNRIPSIEETNDLLTRRIVRYRVEAYPGPFSPSDDFWPGMSYVPDDMGFYDEENQQSTYYNDWYWEVHYEEWNVALPDYMT